MRHSKAISDMHSPTELVWVIWDAVEKTPNRTSDLLPLDQLCYPRWPRQVANSHFCKLRELAIWVLSFPIPALPIMVLYHLSSGIEQRVCGFPWGNNMELNQWLRKTGQESRRPPAVGSCPTLPARWEQTLSQERGLNETSRRSIHEFPLAPNLMDVIQSHFQVCSWKISSVLYAGMPISIFPNKTV